MGHQIRHLGSVITIDTNAVAIGKTDIFKNALVFGALLTCSSQLDT